MTVTELNRCDTCWRRIWWRVAVWGWGRGGKCGRVKIQTKDGVRIINSMPSLTEPVGTDDAGDTVGDDVLGDTVGNDVLGARVGSTLLQLNAPDQAPSPRHTEMWPGPRSSPRPLPDNRVGGRMQRDGGRQQRTKRA